MQASLKSHPRAISLLAFVFAVAGGAFVAAQEETAPGSAAAKVAGVGDGAVAQEGSPLAPTPFNVRESKVIDLASAFPETRAAEVRIFRARKIEIAPDTDTPAEYGDIGPSIAYVTEGSLIEVRTDSAATIKRGVGDASALTRGTARYWANHGSEPAVVLIVDLAPTEDVGGK